MPSYRESIAWHGVCFHGMDSDPVEADKEATCVAVNGKFSLIAVGTRR